MKDLNYKIDKKHKPTFIFFCNKHIANILGDKALRQIIEDSRKIADRCTNPADRDLILRSASDVESMVNALSELRTQGKVRTIQESLYQQLLICKNYSVMKKKMKI